MATFEMKPVTCEAVQYLGDATTRDEVVALWGGQVGEWEENGPLSVATSIGMIFMMPNDWAIKDKFGGMYAFGPDQFENTYRPVA